MISIEMVRSASHLIAPYVHRTPLERNAGLSKRLGCDVYLKLELFQKTGSFKPRGAINQILALEETERQRGIVGASGGNFAQGAAYGARELGIPAMICMPEDTPSNYVEATLNYGADVNFSPSTAEAFEQAQSFSEEGWCQVHPFDHPTMMAGNGTIGLEILKDLPEATDVVVSIGGGGLISGIATALKETAPGVQVWGVETERADVVSQSLKAGRPVDIEPGSLAKTLGAPYTSLNILEHIQSLVDDVVVVSDEEAYQGVLWFFERTKLVTELAAGAAIAAAEKLSGRFRPNGQVVLVVCGGNVSSADLCSYGRLFGP
jgi:threonine dehydratase